MPPAFPPSLAPCASSQGWPGPEAGAEEWGPLGVPLSGLSPSWAVAEGGAEAIVGMLGMTQCTQSFPTPRGTDQSLGVFLLQPGNL